jgi:thiamine biosynthesis lipoprotein ApbE
MTTKAATTNGLAEQEAKYSAAIDECLDEIAAIRREMKKPDSVIRRFEAATRRKLDRIRANLHVEKTA